MLIHEELTHEIRGAVVEVHRHLGPGLQESAYEICLCRELSSRRMSFERQVALPVEYKGVKLDCGYRLDIIVKSKVVLELKSVEQLTSIHEAQLLTYLKLSGLPVGLLINFNVAVVKDGIRRLVLSSFLRDLRTSVVPT
jgi:GxxExxY protein